MFNWKKMSLVLLAAVSLLSGCTKSNIVSPEGGTRADDGQPDTEIDKNIKIDWLEVREELRDQYLEPYGAFADYVMDLDARYNEETGVLTVLLPVTHQTTPEAQSLMRRMSWLPSALVYIPRISITRSLRQTKKATLPTTAAF